MIGCTEASPAPCRARVFPMPSRRLHRHAPLHHRRRIARPGPRQHSRRNAGRRSAARRRRRHRARAPPAGLRPRASHADREGHRRVPLRRARRRDARQRRSRCSSAIATGRTGRRSWIPRRARGDDRRHAAPRAPSRACAPATPISRASSSTIATTRATSSSARRRARRRRASPRRPICKRFLDEFGVRIGSHLVHLGGIDAARPTPMPERHQRRGRRVAAAHARPDAERAMIDAHRRDQARRQHARRHLRGRRRRTARRTRLARLVGPQARRTHRRRDHVDSGGEGRRDRHGLRGGARARAPRCTTRSSWRRAARAPGNVRRATNRAGGLEGGMTTGEPLVVRVAMKPISTLMRPLGTVDVATGERRRRPSPSAAT